MTFNKNVIIITIVYRTYRTFSFFRKALYPIIQKAIEIKLNPTEMNDISFLLLEVCVSITDTIIITMFNSYRY